MSDHIDNLEDYNSVMAEEEDILQTTILTPTSPALSIVGSSRANGPRADHDFYRTPAYATEQLLKKELFVGPIWECACGDGWMSDVFHQNGHEVYSTDIVDRGYGDVLDFLSTDTSTHRRYPNIITNPPFKFANEFVEHAKKMAATKFAFFLKTSFLESAGRYPMFMDRNFPLKAVYQFSRRVTLTKPGYTSENKGMISYAWYVWDANHFGKPTIDWIF